jgi:hypothetical protein
MIIEYCRDIFKKFLLTGCPRFIFITVEVEVMQVVEMGRMDRSPGRSAQRGFMVHFVMYGPLSICVHLSVHFYEAHTSTISDHIVTCQRTPQLCNIHKDTVERKVPHLRLN